MTPTLRLGSVRVRFEDGTTLAIRLTPDSLVLSAGELLVLTGDNGSGKSSYLKTMSGVFGAYSDGKVQTEGQAIAMRDGEPIAIVPAVSYSRTGPQVLRAGYLCQSPRGSVFCRSVSDELAFSLEHSHAAPSETVGRVAAALAELAQFGLSGDAQPHHLSKGQQQLLGFASLIQTEPELLFLDEPSACLDDGALAWLVEKIKGLTAASKPIVVCVASHDSRLLSQLSAMPNAKTATLEGAVEYRGEGHSGRAMAWDRLPGARDIPTSTLTLRNVRVQRGNADLRLALLALHPGQCLVVSGPNGVGKTSLLECLAGYLPTVEGSISAGDPGHASSRRQLKRSVSYAFQNAEEQICFVTSRDELSHPPKRVEWRRSCAGLLQRLNVCQEDVPWHLSFGQRKILTYCSLLFSSPILLADEPFSSLDRPFRALLRTLLDDYTGWGGICIITTSHPSEELQQLQNVSVHSLDITHRA